MKIKYMFIAGCLLLTSACSDFLDHPLTTSVSDDNIGEIIQRNPTKLGEFLGSATGLSVLSIFMGDRPNIWQPCHTKWISIG